MKKGPQAQRLFQAFSAEKTPYIVCFKLALANGLRSPVLAFDCGFLPATSPKSQLVNIPLFALWCNPPGTQIPSEFVLSKPLEWKPLRSL